MNTTPNTTRNKKSAEDFNPNAFQLISSSSSNDGNTRTTVKAMGAGYQAGVLVTSRVEMRNSDGTYSATESMAYVPGVQIKYSYDENGNVSSRYLA